ncbi:consortin [Sardina pilchardus]|uniref:consortin n=1 Tax=Sardina pilchardus TaxID=27697 RepID=UPI002E1543C6
MDEGQAQGDEHVRRGQGAADLLYNHGDHPVSVSVSVLAPAPASGLRSPDENQNRLMEEGEDVVRGSHGRRRSQPLDQQDSVNNNGSCEEEEEREEEEDSSKVEEEDEEEDSHSGAFSPDLDSQIRDSSSCSPTGVEELVSSPEECPQVGSVEGHAEERNALRPTGGGLPGNPPAPALDLGEPCDNTLLPQRLHQIAEALVLEEDYERALRFIQLERLYHERLLANLASLQEQWECRWRCAGGAEGPTADRTPIDPDQLDRLSHICRTHRQPSVKTEQCETADKVQKNSVICRRTRAEEEEEEEERLSTPQLPCHTGSAADSARVTMEKESDARERETSPQPTDATDGQQMATESSQLPHPSPDASPRPPTETLTGSAGLSDRPPSNDCAAEGGPGAELSAKGAGPAGETPRDGRPAEDFPAAPAAAAAAAGEASRSPSREGPGEEEEEEEEEERQARALSPQQQQPPHTQPSLSQHMEPAQSTHTPDETLTHTLTHTTTSSSTTTTTAGTHTKQKKKAEPEVLRSSQPEERTAGDGEEEEDMEEEEEEEDVEEAEDALELEEEGGGGGGGGGDEDGESMDLDVPEVIPESEEQREQNREVGVETVEPVKVATLDDMAKRIKVEEISPASGLVSILKRRASLEGACAAQPAPKPKALAKRKVRFREPDDGFDQDEVSGDSWLLLLLLCLATVVISVGGTALYCTVGDAQSTICTDFSHNMDFYVGQVQRGVTELKHWFSPSS